MRLDADPQEVRRCLLALKGIGPWTVEYVAMRSLGDRDAFPASDLGLRKAIPIVSNRPAPQSWRRWRKLASVARVRRDPVVASGGRGLTGSADDCL
ncbi:MAG: hypothetical protein J4F98_16230 [Acidobacteria bacterium]|nr:hypothetical protein [Acidobacteriota bacterium]